MFNVRGAREIGDRIMTYTLEPNKMVCPRCEGLGQTHYTYPVVDYENGGYLEERLDCCEECDGSGAIEIEEDE